MANTIDGWRAELLDGTIVPIKVTTSCTPNVGFAFGMSNRITIGISLPCSDGRTEELALNASSVYDVFADLAKLLHGRAVLLSPGMESRKELVDRVRREAFTEAASVCDRVSLERRHRDTEPTCICYTIGRGACSDCDDAIACEVAIRARRDAPVTGKAQAILSDAKIPAMIGVCNGEIRVFTARDHVPRAAEHLGREIDGMKVCVDEERLDRRGRP